MGRGHYIRRLRPTEPEVKIILSEEEMLEREQKVYDMSKVKLEELCSFLVANSNLKEGCLTQCFDTLNTIINTISIHCHKSVEEIVDTLLVQKFPKKSYKKYYKSKKK